MLTSPMRGISKACLAGLLLWLSACATEPFQVYAAPPDPDNPLGPSDPGYGAKRLAPPVKVRGAEPVVGKPHGLGLYDYDDRPLEYGLCYSSQLNTPAQLLGRARELCPQGGEVTLVSQDAFFNNCSLFQPHRATFLCIPGPAPEQKYK